MGLLSEALERAGAGRPIASRVATQAYGTLVGLQMDLMATGDRARVDLAVEELCLSLDEAVAKCRSWPPTRADAVPGGAAPHRPTGG